MKAKLSPSIVLAIAILASGFANSAQIRPTPVPMTLACESANRIIPELIEVAPHGAGWINRSQAWLENWIGVFCEFLSWIFGIRWEGDLSKVSKAVIEVDIKHTFLFSDLRIIMDAGEEVVERILPSKMQTPMGYIIGLESLKSVTVDPKCKVFLRTR